MNVGKVTLNRSGAVVVVVLAGLLLVGASVGKGGKKMHLGVPPSLVVNAMTESLPNDNSGSHSFFYDRNGQFPFSVPDGYSFVVTDFILKPGDLASTSDYTVVVGLSNGEGRTFTHDVVDQQGLHVALGGAMIMTAGTPTARNTPSSTGACDMRILGYFVKADALDYSESPFPSAE